LSAIPDRRCACETPARLPCQQPVHALRAQLRVGPAPRMNERAVLEDESCAWRTCRIARAAPLRRSPAPAPDRLAAELGV
jgi:hypothetical protein